MSVPSSTTPPNEPNGGTPDLRVIVVGRTALDASLRRDPKLEIARVRTPLEAVGELADPIDGSSPARAAIIVSSESQPQGSDAADFVAALQLIDPDAPVLIEQPGASGRAVAPYDATIRSEASSAEMRDVVSRIGLTKTGWIKPTPVDADSAAVQAARAAAAARGAPANPATPAAAVQAPAAQGPAASVQANQPSAPAPKPAAAPSAPPRAASATGAAETDAVLVKALLSGRDPILPALELIRARLGQGDVNFIPAVDAQGKAVPAVAGGAIVSLAGRTMGWLRSAAAGPGLQAQADWLGLWLGLTEQQATLRHAAMVDDLTGAYNRRYFDRYMDQAIEHAKRNRLIITLMVFDIDHFKTFNDRFGHAAGDQILRETVLLLQSVIRPSDRVCRIGGDEFAVIFYDATGPRDPGSRPPDDPQTIARRFQHQIREHRFPKLGDSAPGALTISAGLATYPWDGRSASELVERADQLALESKRAGKNAIRVGPGTE